MRSKWAHSIMLDDGRKAKTLKAHRIDYANGYIESGYVRGLGEDDFYVRIAHADDKNRRMIWCARRDEMEALITAIGAALYVDSIAHLKRYAKTVNEKAKARR